MPRLNFVKKARKAQKEHGIKKGDSYYWAAFRIGRSSIKKVWKERPRPSQLTLSEFMGSFLSVQEMIEDSIAEVQNAGEDRKAVDAAIEDLASNLETAADEIQELSDQCDEKLNNMPEGLQQGPSGQTLEQRRDRCSELSDEIRSLADDVRNTQSDDPEEDPAGEAVRLAEEIDWSAE